MRDTAASGWRCQGRCEPARSPGLAMSRKQNAADGWNRSMTDVTTCPSRKSAACAILEEGQHGCSLRIVSAVPGRAAGRARRHRSREQRSVVGAVLGVQLDLQALRLCCRSVRISRSRCPATAVLSYAASESAFALHKSITVLLSSGTGPAALPRQYGPGSARYLEHRQPWGAAEVGAAEGSARWVPGAALCSWHLAAAGADCPRLVSGYRIEMGCERLDGQCRSGS